MKISRRTILAGSISLLGTACYSAQGERFGPGEETSPVSFEPFATGFAEVMGDQPQARLVSAGHTWSEGPVWDAERARLYFTDVPRNRAYRWSADGDKGVFLDPSGVDPEEAVGMREPGANGLAIGRTGELLICNHGRRALEAMDLATGARRSLVDRFEAKRFNSPNDLVEASDGTIYFTDPPYGLEGLNNSPLKQLEINGVYRLAPDGKLTRIVDFMTFPNGIVLSPDERSLYVSQSDPAAPLVRRFDIDALRDGRGEEGELWFNCQPFMHELGGLPDGMAVSTAGHVFLAGPAGVLVIDPSGQCLGRISTGRATANCAFGEDGMTLFMTAADRVLSVRTRVMGLGRF